MSMNGVNLFVSALFWFLIASLMNIDWAEIIAVTFIAGSLIFVVAVLRPVSVPDNQEKHEEEPGMRPGYMEGVFHKETGLPGFEGGRAKALTIEKGIIIAEPWISKILAGEKAWEMRSTRTPMRGTIALVKKGTKTVVGLADIYDVEGPLSLEDLRRTTSKHCVTESEFTAEGYNWFYAWKMKNILKLKTPVPYKHKSGATVWVVLDDEAIEKIASSDFEPVHS